MKKYIKSATDSFELSYISDLFYSTIENLGYTADQIHTVTYDEAKQIESKFTSNLRNNGIDLSYKSAIVTLRDGTAIKVGGNAGSIAYGLLRGVINAGWKKTTYIDPYSAAKIYEEDRYGYCKAISSSRAQSLLDSFTGSRHHGIGSQGYIDEYTRSLYEDNEGNIKVAIHVFRWD